MLVQLLPALVAEIGSTSALDNVASFGKLNTVITPRTPHPLPHFRQSPERDVVSVPHLSTFLAPVPCVPLHPAPETKDHLAIRALGLPRIPAALAQDYRRAVPIRAVAPVRPEDCFFAQVVAPAGEGVTWEERAAREGIKGEVTGGARTRHVGCGVVRDADRDVLGYAVGAERVGA